MKYNIVALAISMLIVTACGEQKTKVTSDNIEEIIELAKEEGAISSVGMPDDWANWKQTWDDLTTKYGLIHNDTDMTSAQEISKMHSEGVNGTVDIGDVGMAFGNIAIERGITMPYKTSYWDDIPAWAKDKDGHWMLSYTGAMSFIINKKLTKGVVPKSWKELMESDITVNFGDPRTAQNYAVALLSAAVANGGSETNIEPGIEYFSELAKKKRLTFLEFSLDALKREEISIEIRWDFLTLKYLEQLGEQAKDFVVVIPGDGSIIDGYTTILNKNAPHPNAAKLAREYILSDEGQINLARGYARPIRTNVTIPSDVAKKLLPNEMYTNVTTITDREGWEKEVRKLQRLWQEKVVGIL